MKVKIFYDQGETIELIPGPGPGNVTRISRVNGELRRKSYYRFPGQDWWLGIVTFAFFPLARMLRWPGTRPAQPEG